MSAVLPNQNKEIDMTDEKYLRSFLILYRLNKPVKSVFFMGVRLDDCKKDTLIQIIDWLYNRNEETDRLKAERDRVETERLLSEIRDKANAPPPLLLRPFVYLLDRVFRRRAA
jgi:hypothetical protein